MEESDLPRKPRKVRYHILVSKVYAHVSEYLYPHLGQYRDVQIPLGDINKYQICRIVGGGKFSNVFIGTDGFNRYALKIFKNVKQSYIKRELFINQQIKDIENVVKMHDIVIDPKTKTYTMVLEYCKNSNWKTVFNQFTIENCRWYMYQLLTALDRLHSRGIMHRDVKQHNILYDHKHKKFRLADFGLSEIYFPMHQYNTGVGTLRFMAPEMLLEYPYYDYGVDIWSAGIVLAEMAINSPMFEGEGMYNMLCSLTEVFTSSPILVLAEKLRIDLPNFVLRHMSPASYQKWDRLYENSRMKDETLFDLLKKMLVIDPRERISARDALKHPFFDSLRPKKKISNNK